MRRGTNCTDIIGAPIAFGNAVLVIVMLTMNSTQIFLDEWSHEAHDGSVVCSWPATDAAQEGLVVTNYRYVDVALQRVSDTMSQISRIATGMSPSVPTGWSPS